MTPTLTVIVPAHNEEEGLPATLGALLRQTSPAEEIIVVDDGSTDRTGALAEAYGVTVLRPPANLGSKAKAQNYALAYCRTDLVLPVDADTVLADDYIQKIKPAFDDPAVAIAAGAVRTRFQSTIWERGREIECLFGHHWFRPVQNLVNSPTVCSGCCSVFVLDDLVAFGGFPTRTMVEDIDYTWSQQIAGRHAVYVADAVAYAAEPTSLTYMRKQLWRWKSGWFQNVRLHYRQLLRRKPMLALWVTLSLLEIFISPLALALPVLWVTVFHRTVISAVKWWALGEGVLMLPPLTLAMIKRHVNPLQVISCYPSYYVLKALNFYYDWKAGIIELLLVPLGRASSLNVYEKGRAHTPGTEPAVQPERESARSRYVIPAGALATGGSRRRHGIRPDDRPAPPYAARGNRPPADRAAVTDARLPWQPHRREGADGVPAEIPGHRRASGPPPGARPAAW